MSSEIPTKPAPDAPPVIMTAAGSDSSAGAGIQADLKTFSRLGIYGVTAVSAVVAEVPGKIAGIVPISPDHFRAQIRQLFAHYPIAAAKSGMLGSSAHVKVLAEEISLAEENGVGLQHLVVDPVLAASTGDALAAEGTVAAMEEHLFPHSTLVTPNLNEAEVFLGRSVKTRDDMEATVVELAARWGCAVLLKGGHLEESEPAVDLLATRGGAVVPFSGERIPGGGVHGTGCTYSAAIASYLVQGGSLEDSINRAKKWTACAIDGAFSWDGGKIRALDHLQSDSKLEVKI